MLLHQRPYRYRVRRPRPSRAASWLRLCGAMLLLACYGGLLAVVMLALTGGER